MFTLMRGLPPDLLIVLDKSGSMSDVVGPDTKWNQVRAALDMTVMALQGQIKWGLQLFPTGTEQLCCHLLDHELELAGRQHSDP